MIKVNSVIGQYNVNFGNTITVDIPDATDVIFSIDNSFFEISINDDQHYIEYNSTDGFICFENNSANEFEIKKIYIKLSTKRGYSTGEIGQIRIWGLIN